MAAVTHEIVTQSSTGTDTHTSGAFTPAAGDLIVNFFGAATSSTVPVCTSSTGLTFTAVTFALCRASVDRLWCFVSNGPATAVSMTLTCVGQGAGCIGSAHQISGVAGMTRFGGDAVRQSAVQSNAAAGTPAPAFPVAALTANCCLGSVMNATSPATMTPPASWTEGVADVGISGPTTGFEYAFRNSGTTTTTVTWGSASASAFGAVIVELDISLPVPDLLMTPM